MKIWKSNIIDETDGISLRHDESFCISEHSHEFYEMVYILKGTTMQIINNKIMLGKKGDVFFLNLNDKHSYTKNKNYESINCLISTELVNKIIEKGIPVNSINKKISLNYDKIKYFEQLLSFIEKELSDKNLRYIENIHATVFILLNTLSRLSEINDNPENSDKIEVIIDYITENFISVSPKIIAQEFHYNQNYLCKIFKETTKKTMTQYINEIKISKAMYLLKNTDLSIENIATDVGILDKKNFYKLFKSYCGITPNRFRKNS